MVCYRHKTRPARRRCYYCGRHICPECQRRLSHHIFCGNSCHTKYRIKSTSKRISNAYCKNAEVIFKNIALLVNQSASAARGIFQNIPLSESLLPFLLSIITILSIHIYILVLPVDMILHTVKSSSITEPLQNTLNNNTDAPDYSQESRDERQRMSKKAPVYYLQNITRGDTSIKELSLTFDGGAEDSAAKEILEILRKKNIKTTIFLTGEFIKKYPELVKEMAEDGHEIGNHTFSHPHLTTYEKNLKHITLQEIDNDFLSDELKKTAELFKETTGKNMSPLWRAPYGELNKEILQWAFDAGYTHISWTTDKKKRQSLDSLDWVKDEDSTLYLTADEIKEKIINFDKNGSGVNGGIVLMHLGTERQTQEAHKKLEDIIDALSSQGYRFVKVSQMLKGYDTTVLARR